jgi:hypothetical protein
MYTIRHIDLDGKQTDGPQYDKESTAELAATWRSKKQQKTWRVVDLDAEAALKAAHLT